MNNEMQIFQYKEVPVRTVLMDGEPWWVLADVCKVLGLSNPTHVANRLDDDEKQRLGFNPTSDVGLGHNGATIISESGLYKVILRSDKPEAKEFTRWVTHEVLPSIRKHGGYIAGQETMTDEELMARALLVADSKIKERDKRIAEQAEQIKAMLPAQVFADAVATSPQSCLVGELAKILKQNGVETGQNRLFEWLRKNGYLITRRGTDYNMPTQRSMELGLFEIKETAITHSDGRTIVSRTPKVTGKGQNYFVNKFLA